MKIEKVVKTKSVVVVSVAIIIVFAVSNIVTHIMCKDSLFGMIIDSAMEYPVNVTEYFERCDVCLLYV